MVNYIISGVFAILLLITGFIAYEHFTAAEYSMATDEIETFFDPIQNDVSDVILPDMTFGKVTHSFVAKAEYIISGELVSSRRYRSGYMSDLSPWDYAIIWGVVPSLKEYLKFNQVVRYCLFSYKSDAPIDPEYILAHMSNNHLIPTTKNIRKALKKGRKGDKVVLEGYLVFVSSHSPKRGSSNWNSSLTRSDKSDGACEIIYLTKLRINDKVYE